MKSYPEYFLWSTPWDGQPMLMAMDGLVGLEFEALACLATSFTRAEPNWVWADMVPHRDHPAVEDWDTMQSALHGYVSDMAIIELEREADRHHPRGDSV